MKRITAYIAFVLVLVSSCEEIPLRGSFEFPLLKYHGDAYFDEGTALVSTSEGYTLCGTREILFRSEKTSGGTVIDSSHVDMAIIRTDSDGDLSWETTSNLSGTDNGRSVIGLGDGSFVSVGTYNASATTTTDKEVVITKTGSGGSVEWQRIYGGYGNQLASDIINTPDQGFLIVGSSDVENIAGGFGDYNPDGKMNIYLLKLSSAGDSIWSYSHGFEGNDYGVKIVNDISGSGFLVLATTDDQGTGLAQNSIMLLRINAVGTVTGFKTYGTTGNEEAKDLIVNGDNYIVLGAAGPNIDAYTEIYAIRLMQNIFSPPLFEKRVSVQGKKLQVNAIAWHPSGFYVIAGGAGDPLAENMMFYFMDESGNEYRSPHIPSGSGGQIINDVVVDSNESIVSVGTNSTESSSLITFYKFEQPVK